MVNEIKCTDLAELATVCAQLQREGIAFTAHTASLIIFITGY